MCAGMLAIMAAWGQSGLAEASLEQLLDIQVTTVSKKEQKLARTAAAVFVLGAEEIRRSGALTLPDSAAPGAGCTGGTDRRQRVGNRDPRIQQPLFQQGAGAGGRPGSVQRRIQRGLLGSDRSPGGGHRTHRGDSRTGCDCVGGKRSQRGDQCDHAAGEGHSGWTGDGGGWFRAGSAGTTALWRPGGHSRRVPDVCQVFAFWGSATGGRARRSRRVVAHARWISLGLGIGAAGWAHGTRRLVRATGAASRAVLRSSMARPLRSLSRICVSTEVICWRRWKHSSAGARRPLYRPTTTPTGARPGHQ